MAGKYGVKETKELFDLGFALAKAGREATADGKVNILDIGLVFPLLGKVMPAVDGIALVPLELGEIDEQDAMEVMAYAKSKLPELTSDENVKKHALVYIKAGLAVAEAIAVARGA